MVTIYYRYKYRVKSTKIICMGQSGRIPNMKLLLSSGHVTFLASTSDIVHRVMLTREAHKNLGAEFLCRHPWWISHVVISASRLTDATWSEAPTLNPRVGLSGPPPKIGSASLCPKRRHSYQVWHNSLSEPLAKFRPLFGQDQILYYTGRVTLPSNETGKSEGGAGLVGEYQKLSLVHGKFHRHSGRDTE